ncbi:MAG: 2-hydroxymuconate tautomerase [SAR324 cluster bacterium]|nr:2-hydroxymuconate tautomerase [SAR324 cluster bacterium]
MPFVVINVFEGRSEEQKSETIKEVTEVLVRTLGAKKEAVRVLIQEHDKANWGIGGTSAKELGR